MERRKFKTKAEARQAVWDALVEARVARFPFPNHGRIPDFEEAREADEYLLAHPLFQKVRCIVTGSVAVTRDGHRCGKGHGYGDLEYVILRELGQPPIPVVTTVHAMQMVEVFPADPHENAGASRPGGRRGTARRGE
jgi:5-formyltetrahydrofolate cyclo-ligase